jgi:hypothetical protein
MGFFHSMNKPQRVILAIYCLLLAYCCVWIPWRVTVTAGKRQLTDVVYSLVWVVPDLSAVPDLKLIFLRIVALTAISAAAVITAELTRRPATRS